MWRLRIVNRTPDIGDANESLLQADKFYQDAENITNASVDKHWCALLRQPWRWIAQSAMLACSMTLFILLMRYEPSDEQCTTRLFPYSPALAAVTYHDEMLHGAFSQQSEYRGTPTPEMDRRWEALWDWGAFNVPENKIHLLNKSTSLPWHHTDQHFGGGIAGLFWGFHQIHCLDILRQVSYQAEYELAGKPLPAILRAPEEERRVHLDHCIELLRMDMMCQADVTPYLVMEAAPGSPQEALRVDFSVFKKCRDFSKIQEWMKGHIAITSVPDSKSHNQANIKHESCH